MSLFFFFQMILISYLQTVPVDHLDHVPVDYLDHGRALFLISWTSQWSQLL